MGIEQRNGMLRTAHFGSACAGEEDCGGAPGGEACRQPCCILDNLNQFTFFHVSMFCRAFPAHACRLATEIFESSVVAHGRDNLALKKPKTARQASLSSWERSNSRVVPKGADRRRFQHPPRVPRPVLTFWIPPNSERSTMRLPLLINYAFFI